MDSLSLLILAAVSLAVFALATLGTAALICLGHWLARKRSGPWSVVGFSALLLFTPALAAGPQSSAAAIDFNRDIRPILSDNCFTCHGPDQSRRKAGLRLDRRDGALAELRSGNTAVVPGKRAESELWTRITAEEATEQMPPPSTGKKLTREQIERLGRWIDQGARWEEHWAYAPPKRPRLPSVKSPFWPQNAIDFFVLARLEKEGLAPSAMADRATLIRRVTLDLTGLPPTPAEVDAFLNDPSPTAYEKVVDRLLASPHYGERLALHWLDLARFADTNGYRLDNHRDVWKWRDWVIAAFNRNRPFDQFTVEQLAGDLLPHATLDQKVATGFHRNTMVNFGNGSDPQEYLSKAVSDRVATTATVWLGSTLACAQCHDHKYDPFTQKDYYRLYAFFNNVPEKGLDGEKANPVPSLQVPDADQKRRLATVRRELARRRVRGIPNNTEYERLRKAEADLLDRIPSAMVMQEMPKPRPTRVLLRGDYLSEGEMVMPDVPASLPPMPRGAPANRLGLARWLTDPAHPLTSRVTVNRFWQLYFGAGLVRTVDDFGSQGEAPSHPELLDWLATEFIASGWDIKHVQKIIVLSATYRQSSRLTADLKERDPHNRLLARGPRFRLDAETVRDNALAVSGLLTRCLGGPSVRPYQPVGLWEQVALGGNYSSQTYVPSHGADLYRRGLYTYVKRSMPHPSLAAFDAPIRETCTVSRARTNTPLQALVLLNDPTYLEASRALAQRVLRQGSPENGARVRYAFRLCTGRFPEAGELRTLMRVLGQQLRIYRHDRQAAKELTSLGESQRPADLDVAELAAWTALGNLLLNLDETMTKE
jgi:hypothetical protein